MAANSDATTSAIAVKFKFTAHQEECLGPTVVEALKNADARIDLPEVDSNSVAVRVSTLDGNGSRVDSEGAIYTPIPRIVELTEQTIVIGDGTGPEIQNTMTFTVPGVSDLQTIIPAIYFEYVPRSANVRISPPRLGAGTIVYDFFRIDDDTTPPYPVVTIRGYGRVVQFPAPSVT